MPAAAVLVAAAAVFAIPTTALAAAVEDDGADCPVPASNAIGSSRLPVIFAVATGLGCASGVLGYLFAFFFEFPVGASQTAVAAGAVIAAALVRLVETVVARARA